MKKRILALLMAATMVFGLAACGSKDDKKDSGNAGADKEAIQNLIDATEGTVSLEVWCSELPAYQAVMKEVVEDFKKAYPDVTFDITIGAQSESQAKDRVLEDPEAAADVFVFADDQINDLVNAGALQEVVKTYTYDPAQANVGGTVEAAKVNGKMYAYPLTASNGYFLYYDSRYITAEDAKSWESLIAAAEKQGLQVGMDIGNAWYLYGFFAGAGCDLTLNADGKTNSCNWNNAAGLAAAKSVMDICSSDNFIAIGDADAQAMVVNKDNKLVAYVDGVWASTAFQTGYADGYSATKLPTFKVDGKDTQMGSYAGYKLVGVSAYSDFTGWAMLLAEFITSEASQAKIGVAVNESPANAVAAKAEALQSNPALVALSLQSEFSDRQVVGGKFWEPANALGGILNEGTDNIQKALDDAVAGITQAAE